MTKPPNNTTLESRRQSAALERATGEWYCQSGSHYTRAKEYRWRKRRICLPCRNRLIALTKKQAKP